MINFVSMMFFAYQLKTGGLPIKYLVF